MTIQPTDYKITVKRFGRCQEVEFVSTFFEGRDRVSELCLDAQVVGVPFLTAVTVTDMNMQDPNRFV